MRCSGRKTAPHEVVIGEPVAIDPGLPRTGNGCNGGFDKGDGIFSQAVYTETEVIWKQ